MLFSPKTTVLVLLLKRNGLMEKSHSVHVLALTVVALSAYLPVDVVLPVSRADNFLVSCHWSCWSFSVPSATQTGLLEHSFLISCPTEQVEFSEAFGRNENLLDTFFHMWEIESQLLSQLKLILNLEVIMLTRMKQKDKDPVISPTVSY